VIILKNVVFDIKNSNWGLIGPDSWREREWKIYDDMSVSYTITYNSTENKTNTFSFKLSIDEFNSIISNIESAKNDNTKVDACDGEAWEFVEYNNGMEVWKRNMGYIYGISSLENIVDILRKETK
jgi:hypothetical protein